MNEDIKYSAPSKWDHAPYGKLWVSHQDGQEEAITYIQVAQDPENPRWLRMGMFLEGTFGDKYTSEFIETCLVLFNRNEAIKLSKKDPIA